MFVVLGIALAKPAYGASIEIYAYTDKVQYMPGDTGTLKIWVYNSGTEGVFMENVTIEYPWYSAFIWEGNETINTTDPITAKGNWSITRTFTVPKDGRAQSGNIRIFVETDKVDRQKNVYLSIADNPTAASVRYMEQVTTLLSALVVLVLVCTFIVAVAIFLSARKAQVTWKTEEKPQ